MRSESEIRTQLYASSQWLNIQTDESLIVQGETEVRALKWALGETKKIEGD